MLPPIPFYYSFRLYYYYEFISSIKMHFITLKKEQNNYSKCSAFASALLHLFFTSNSVVCVYMRHKKFFCSRAQGTQAMALFEIFKMTKKLNDFEFFHFFTSLLITLAQEVITIRFLNHMLHWMCTNIFWKALFHRKIESSFFPLNPEILAKLFNLILLPNPNSNTAA